MFEPLRFHCINIPVGPSVKEIIRSLKVVDILLVQEDKSWSNFYMATIKYGNFIATVSPAFTVVFSP